MSNLFATLDPEFSEPKNRNLSNEIVTAKAAGDYLSLLSYLPDPDPVLRSQGRDIQLYREITSDPHLWSVMQTRKSGVLSLEWEIDRGKAKSRQAKAIEKIFSSLNLADLISDILDAPFYGFTVQEILWKKEGGYLVPEKIISKPQEWFRFNEEKELLFLSLGNPNGEVLTARWKFLITQFNPAYINPYGERLLSKCFWPATFKKGGLKFWLKFIEKFGTPFIMGKYRRNSLTQGEKLELLSMLNKMVQDAVAVIPEDVAVDPLEASNVSANSQIYNDMISFCNAEMSKAILGQTLTTEIGQTGGAYAASKTHFQVKQDIVDTDKRLVEKTINKLIRWIYEINFGESGEVPKFIMYEEEEVDKTLAERDQILTNTGVKFTKDYFIKNYGLSEEDFEIGEKAEPATKEEPEKFSEFKEAKPDERVTSLMNSIPPRLMQAQMEQTLKPVFDIINGAKDYSEIMDKLNKTFPKMKTSQLENLFQKALFVSELGGRIDAKQ